MADKSKRGEKRQCTACDAKFYDLLKSPIICPVCGEEFVLEVAEETPEPAKEVAVKPVEKVVDGDKDSDDIDDDLLDIDDDEDIDISDDDDTFLESDDEGSEAAVSALVAPVLKKDGGSDE